MKTPYGMARAPGVGILAILLAVSWSCGRTNTDVGRDARALQDFNRRVQGYVKVHKNSETGNPHIVATHSGEKIVDRQHLMAARIQGRRGDVKEGNIFTPEIRGYFDRAINSAYLANEPGIQASLECVAPVDGMSLKANDLYPENASYTMTPPTILLHIPPLPPELEYRIVNRDLILRDPEANLVVDIMRNAVRPVPGRRICDD